MRKPTRFSASYVDRDTQTHALQHTTWIEIRMEGIGGVGGWVGGGIITFGIPCKQQNTKLKMSPLLEGSELGKASKNGCLAKHLPKILERKDYPMPFQTSFGSGVGAPPYRCPNGTNFLQRWQRFGEGEKTISLPAANELHKTNFRTCQVTMQINLQWFSPDSTSLNHR